jgi:RNA polymerase sigma factor (sigma-70 family)
MSKFNPDFWEVTISEESWRQFSAEDGLYYEGPDEAERRRQRAERAEALWRDIRGVMAEVLTARQREVVTLYFFEELNQRQIADRLGISQQSVSEHLYGKIRNGRAVGGALRKLRNACAGRGVRWESV